MNAIIEKIKNRSPYFSELSNTDEANLTSTELEKEKNAIVDVKKGQQITAFERHIDKEIELMQQHCFSKEKNTLMADEVRLESGKLSHKIAWHGILQKAISPATIKSIHYANSYLGESSTRINFLKIPIVKCFLSAVIITFVLSITGYCTNETRLLTGYYSFRLTDMAVLLLNQCFFIATVVLGTLVYWIVKLLKHIQNTTLTADRVAFYWKGLLLSLIGGVFLSNSRLLEPYLTEIPFINLLIIGALAGFMADISNTIFKR